MHFHSLGLSDKLVQGILATGYTAPTEIQSLAIPTALAGKDVIGCAQTGTGKTAAFVLPILQRLSASIDTNRRRHHVSALIITPTRELALQVEESVRGYGRFLRLRSLTVYGGVNIEKQLRDLSHGVDIVIATPGRLIDHINRRSIDLSHIEVLVLDEADRMFDMGFINDVRKIIALTPKERQTLLFSATISNEVKSLALGVQKHPKIIEVGEQRNPLASITQHIYPVQKDMKMDLLLHILASEEMDSVLVFSRTKHGADKITRILERKGVKAVALHSDRTQSQRQRALEGFKRAHYQVLVATDIAARGIDVEGISHVINYDVPTFAEDYIHRIGRTGRASAIGDALTFVSHDEEIYLRRIEQFISKRLARKQYPTFKYVKAAPDKQSNVQKEARREDQKVAQPKEKGKKERTYFSEGQKQGENFQFKKRKKIFRKRTER